MESSQDVSIIPLLELGYIIMMIFIILLIAGFIFEISKYLKKEKFNLPKVIKIILTYGCAGLITWLSPYVFFGILTSKNILLSNKNLENEKIVKLTEDERLKKLNVYRKSNKKDILLANKTETEHYLNFLKKNRLDETALK